MSAQGPSDLSRVKASQISDAQLQQYLTQAKANGLTHDQIEKELIRRGLPESEVMEIRSRMQLLDPSGATTTTSEDPSSSTATENTKRKVNGKTSPDPYEFLDNFRGNTKIFGTELFTNSNLSFEPDLRMATPKDYIIGPDDELNLNIYGLNISQQKLKVTPDGTVNVKYAGIINLNGMSIEAATALIKNRLVKYYPGLSSGQTNIQLSLGNIRSIRVVLIGAIMRPGTYTLPSLATLFNALYLSGGPADNGSFRNIELIRNNKVVKVADLYDFLLKGDQRSNIRLEDNDVIRIPFANQLVTLNGELNRPGIFELSKNESLEDAIQYAGGFKSRAYRGRITGYRFADFERRVIDLSGDSIAFFKPKNGDEFFIDSVINRYQNKVVINGAVFKPGIYALDNGMKVKNLIEKAYGLKEDVYAGRALLVRTRPDLTKEYITIDLKPIISGIEEGLNLQKEDSIHIASIFDLRDTTAVTINGAVRRPGTFRYEEGLTLKSLIMKAEGYSDHATGTGIEISRRKRDIDITKPGSNIIELIRVNDDKELNNASADVKLMPFDIVTIKEDPYYKRQISVTVSGEVLMPAVYTLQSREERLSSLIKRSGGLLYTANISGAKLIRRKKEPVDTAEIRRLYRSVENDADRARIDLVSKSTTDVAINLAYILKNPGSTDDITLEEGDQLIIPRINNTVSVSGEVFRPLDIMFERGKSMKDYISDAGGITQLGKKNRAFVVYANGGSAKIRKVLGIFPNYPRIEPGSSVFVPQKPKKQGFDVAKAGFFISAVTALVTTMAVIFR
jgi:protein involved in polysaccharide export with SLBB domain